jgi:Subtilase family
MCDIVPGQLLISFPQSWENVNPRVACESIGARYIESMQDKLERSELKMRSPFPSSLHRIEVKPGEENHKTAGLYSWFDSLTTARTPKPNSPENSFVVAPNYVLSISGSGSAGAQPPSGKNFSFSGDYGAYQSMTGLPSGSAKSSTTLRVLVVDTGIASDTAITIHSRKNLLNPSTSKVDDDNGHGTAVALLIDNLAPSNEFIIYKAGDANGHLNEWDLLAALVADSGAHVINLSVQYGLNTRVCGICGRQSSSSRSTVFETLMSATAKWANQPVMVAASGNSRATELAYPARFGNLVAVGSVNLDQECNTGDADHKGVLHINHFVAPGGDTSAAQSEYVIELSNGSRYRGTSFACAFASAAALAAMDTLSSTDYLRVLDHLRHQADKSFYWHTSPQYGLGIIRA